jgi:hypothetical protein
MSADKTELRGLVPAELAAALDAIAMSKGMNRNDYVNLVLDAECKRVCHESMVIHRVLRGNPYLSDSHGVAREPASRFHA